MGPRLWHDRETAAHPVTTEEIVQRCGEAHLLLGQSPEPGRRPPRGQRSLSQADLVLGGLTVEDLDTAEDEVEVGYWPLQLEFWWNMRRSTQLVSQVHDYLENVKIRLGVAILEKYFTQIFQSKNIETFSLTFYLIDELLDVFHKPLHCLISGDELFRHRLQVTVQLLN